MELPDKITVTDNPNPRDLVIISIPKMGKGTILGSFTEKYNAIVFNLEKGGYDHISARKIDVFQQSNSFEEGYKNYCEYRNLLLKEKGKYEYLIIDGLSDLDALSEYGGTLMYMRSSMGKKFNRTGTGAVIPFGDPEFKMVTQLPDGNGYQFSRKWFLNQIEIFREISPYRIYAAHCVDKMVSEKGKEEVFTDEIALTGKLKTIFASKVTALGKLVAEDNKRYLVFDVKNEGIIAGSRAPNLKGKILISEEINNKVITYFKNIYK